MDKMLSDLLELYKSSSVFSKYFLKKSVEVIPYKNIESHLPVKGKILDYGCGQGLVAARLAHRAKAIDLWDSSQTAREQAQEICREYSNANVLTQLPDSALYDLILVLSVTQYMTDAQLREAMGLWKEMLKPDGLVLITDIIPPQRRMVNEVFALLRFAVRYKLLFSMILDGIRDLPNYWQRSQEYPLTHYALETVAGMASVAGFELETVSNPNMFPTRYAVLLRPNMPSDKPLCANF